MAPRTPTAAFSLLAPITTAFEGLRQWLLCPACPWCPREALALPPPPPARRPGPCPRTPPGASAQRSARNHTQRRPQRPPARAAQAHARCKHPAPSRRAAAARAALLCACAARRPGGKFPLPGRACPGGERGSCSRVGRRACAARCGWSRGGPQPGEGWPGPGAGGREALVAAVGLSGTAGACFSSPCGGLGPTTGWLSPAARGPLLTPGPLRGHPGRAAVLRSSLPPGSGVWAKRRAGGRAGSALAGAARGRALGVGVGGRAPACRAGGRAPACRAEARLGPAGKPKGSHARVSIEWRFWFVYFRLWFCWYWFVVCGFYLFCFP